MKEAFSQIKQLNELIHLKEQLFDNLDAVRTSKLNEAIFQSKVNNHMYTQSENENQKSISDSQILKLGLNFTKLNQL